MTPASALMFTLILIALFLIFIYLAVSALSWALTTVPAWFTRHLVADDPNPEYSRLDRMDGLHNNKETK